MKVTSKIFKLFLNFLFVLLICTLIISFSHADSLFVSTNADSHTLEITYFFNFTQGSPNSIIAIEKPQDANLIRGIDSKNNIIEPSIIGDFFRFELLSRDIDNFTITFTSRETYQNIVSNFEQVLYVNSNIKLDIIQVNFDTVKNFDLITEIFPRNYKYHEGESRIIITQVGALEDNMFRIRYKREESSSISNWIIILLIIPIFFFITLYIVLKIKPESKEKKLDDFINKEEKEKKESQNIYLDELKTNSKSKEKELIEPSSSSLNVVYSLDNENVDNSVEQNIDKIKITREDKNTNYSKSDTNISNSSLNEIDKIEEFIQKYLTENEQDVVRVISKQEGIMQQEILDNLPIFTKSTLSKIISKLERKKIIERVRVGKVNKLFIGNELKKLVEDEKIQ
ncbi:MAG: helix-turn-helix transcriptional regulator [Candidatus Woesearchaeota archaeon]